jgi:hypothetical protein
MGDRKVLLRKVKHKMVPLFPTQGNQVGDQPRVLKVGDQPQVKHKFFSAVKSSRYNNLIGYVDLLKIGLISGMPNVVYNC